MPQAYPNLTILTAIEQKLDVGSDQFTLKNSYPLVSSFSPGENLRPKASVAEVELVEFAKSLIGNAFAGVEIVMNCTVDNRMAFIKGPNKKCFMREILPAEMIVG